MKFILKVSLLGITTCIFIFIVLWNFIFKKSNHSRCDSVKCQTGQKCDPGTGNCVNNYNCDLVKCQSGQKCDPGTGNCVNNYNCDLVKCQSGQKCDPGTGNCVCDASSSSPLCPTWTKCDPVTGECYLPCSRLKCNDNEECRDSGPVIGKCINKCDLIGNCEENKTCDRTLGKCVGKCDTVTCTAPQICNPITGNCCTRNCIEGKCSDDDNCGGVCMCEEPLICDNISKECRSCSTDCTGLFCDERNECSTTCGCAGEGQTCINKNCEPCITNADCPFSDSNICGSDGKCQP